MAGETTNGGAAVRDADAAADGATGGAKQAGAWDAVRQDAGAVAAEWARRMAERGHAEAVTSAATEEAALLATVVLDAAAADTSPSPAVLARQVARLVQLRAAGGADPYELVEALDLLGELLHERLAAQTRADAHGATDAVRLARATRSLVASAIFTRPAPESPPADGAEREAATSSPEGQSDFVRRLSHDLKNPLGTALGAAETLTDASALENEAQRQQFADIIIRNINKAVALIEEARRPQ